MIFLTRLPSAPQGQWSQAACNTGRFAATPVAGGFCWAEAGAGSSVAAAIKLTNNSSAMRMLRALIFASLARLCSRLPSL